MGAPACLQEESGAGVALSGAGVAYRGFPPLCPPPATGSSRLGPPAWCSLSPSLCWVGVPCTPPAPGASRLGPPGWWSPSLRKHAPLAPAAPPWHCSACWWVLPVTKSPSISHARCGSHAGCGLHPAGRAASTQVSRRDHPGVELRANLKSISHRCHLFEVAIVWELTKETIVMPMGCLQGGETLCRMARNAKKHGMIGGGKPRGGWHTEQAAVPQRAPSHAAYGGTGHSPCEPPALPPSRCSRECIDYKTSMITDEDPLQGVLCY